MKRRHACVPPSVLHRPGGLWSGCSRRWDRRPCTGSPGDTNCETMHVRSHEYYIVYIYMVVQRWETRKRGAGLCEIRALTLAAGRSLNHFVGWRSLLSHGRRSGAYLSSPQLSTCNHTETVAIRNEVHVVRFGIKSMYSQARAVLFQATCPQPISI